MSDHSEKKELPSLEQQWQEAFVNEFHAASIGRMFRGILHNLNGVSQAFSLQAALFKSMFSQADDLLERILADNGEDLTDLALNLRSLLAQRSEMVGQMETKLELSQRIIRRAQPLSDLYCLGEDDLTSLNKIIQYEVDILASLSFFKHDITKDLDLAEGLPALCHCQVEIHNILFVLLLNAIDAVQEREAPKIAIATFPEGDSITVEIRDNGPGIPEEIRSRMCEPFFTTKEGRSGIGLYVACEMAKRIGGRLDCTSEPGDTCFSVTIPTALCKENPSPFLDAPCLKKS